MALGNYREVKKFYGHETLIKLNKCEFHHNQSVKRQMKRLEKPQRSDFHNVVIFWMQQQRKLMHTRSAK